MPYKKKFYKKKSYKKSIIKNSVIKKITDPLGNDCNSFMYECPPPERKFSLPTYYENALVTLSIYKWPWHSMNI